MEYREDGKFEDRPTQVVWNRKFDPVDFRVEKKGEGFELFTSRMHVTYAGGPFTKNSLNLNAVGGQNAFGAVWYYGEKGDNLGGTAAVLRLMTAILWFWMKTAGLRCAQEMGWTFMFSLMEMITKKL